MWMKRYCCRYCKTCMYLSSSGTLAADSRRHYQQEMLHCADNTLGKCPVSVCFNPQQFTVCLSLVARLQFFVVYKYIFY